MKHYIIAPKEYISERFVIDYYDYTKAEALKRYRNKFPQFRKSDLVIY
jgi:hypothetical protein